MSRKKKPMDPVVPEQEGEAAPTIQDVSFKEMLAGPAFYSNKIYASSLALGMRLSFLEAAEGGTESFRTAVFLTWPDAIALRDLLAKQLENVSMEMQIVPSEETPKGDAAE